MDSQKLLAKIAADPSMLKLLEQLTKTSNVQEQRKKKEKRFEDLGNPTHVNEVEFLCKLCGTSTIRYMRMDWDSVDKLYRGGCLHLDNIWLDLPLYRVRQRRPTCDCCPTALQSIDKEELIRKMIVTAEIAHKNS